MRRVLAVVLGIAVSLVTIMLVEALGHRLFPPATPFPTDPVAASSYVEALPAGTKASLLLAWFLGPLLGATAATRVGRWRRGGWVVALVALAGGIANLLALPHPPWMQAAAVLLPLLAGALAGAVRRPSSA